MRPVSLARRLPHWLVPVLVWPVALLVTHPVTTGDTEDYIASVLARLQGIDYNFWEFGHLLWRPLAAALTRASHALTGSTDPRIIALQPIVLLNHLSGLGAALCLYAIMRTLRPSSRAAAPLAVAFLLTQSVLDYAQTGTAYIPGLFLLTAALWLAISAARTRHLWKALAAGGLGALAAAFWFPYALLIPALAVAAALPGNGTHWRPAVLILLSAAAAGTALFLGTAFLIGIRTPAQFIEWVEHASHGIAARSGLSRAALGFGRSLLFIGEDGAIMRRFLVGDPFAPVSTAQLIGTRIWLLGAVWLLGFAVIWHVTRSRAFTLLAVFGTAALPVFAFALLWQGGDMERYLPLYPFLFLIIHELFTNGDFRYTRALRVAVAAALVFMAANNVIGLSLPAAEARRAGVKHRLEQLVGRARNEDVLVCSHLQDDLVAVRNSFPFEPVLDDVDLRIVVLILVGQAQVDTWREYFATQVRDTWKKDRHVWISSRLLTQPPRPEWSWIEGSDPRISWRDFPEFFSAFQLGPLPPYDGFVLLERTPANEALIASLAR
jgi:hypothetical protein